MKIRVISLVLVLVMVCTMLPQVSFKAQASSRWDVINAGGITGEDIVSKARTYIGVPYDTSGGNYKYRTGFGSTMMFDCSGFVYRVCRDVGLASSRENYTMGQTDTAGNPLEGQDANGNYYITAHTQEQRYYGQDITDTVNKYINTGDYSDLLPGDLLFITNNNSTVSHVVIYAGNGRIIHSEGYYGSVAEHPIGRYPTSTNWYFAGCRLVENTYLSKCTSYSAYCAIKVATTTYIKSLPCSKDTDATSTDVEVASKGTQYQAIGLYKNTAGNLWYKVKAKNGSTGYMYAGDTTYVAQSVSDIKGSGITAPKNHKAGATYVLTGTVSSTYNQLTAVSAYVYAGNSEQGAKETGASASVSGNSYSLGGSSVDNQTEFNKLPVGTHTYVVWASYKNYYAKSATSVGTNTGEIGIYKATFNVISGTASCSHSYSSSVTQAANCVNNGIRTYTCTQCGASYTETIAATGSHSYVGEVTTSATCLVDGVYTYTCSKCGESYTEVILATGYHSWGAWGVIQDATCTTTGTRSRKCYVCWADEIESIPVKGHSYGGWVTTTAAGCGTTGTQKRTCSSCGYVQTQSIAATGHSFQSSAIGATCNDYERIRYTCSKCQYYYDEYTNEKYSEWSTTKPTGVDESLIETKTQYRYADYHTTTSYENSLSGYSQISSTWQSSGSGTVQYVKNWPSGFSTGHSLYTTYNKSAKVASVTATEKTAIDSERITGYLYYHWCRGTYADGPINRGTRPTQAGEFNSFHAFYSTTAPSSLVASSDGDGSYTYGNGSCCTDSHWYYCAPVYTQSYTTYRKLFTYGKWESWSSWSDTVYTSSSTRQVETQKLYRYVNKQLGDHVWNSGVVTTNPNCTINGVKTYTCATCGITKTEAVSALNHNYQNGYCTRCDAKDPNYQFVTAISVKTQPTKTSYWIGEDLDITGLTLMVTYSNGTTQTVSSGFIISGFDSTTAGNKTVTVTYSDKIAIFNIEVLIGGIGADNILWRLDNGVLRISGAGKMQTYSNSDPAPWYPYAFLIEAAVIEAGITNIGAYAFQNCNSLVSVDISNSVTEIGAFAFSNCESMENIVIPDSVIGIGSAAFFGCGKLESITIPFVGGGRKNANSTYQYPFGYIFGDTSYTGGVETTQSYYGYSTSSITITNYYIPGSLKSVTVTDGKILYGAFSGCGKLVSITVPDGITSIGDYAFLNCSNLVSFTIPDSVTSIGNTAFGRCSSLANITIPDSVTNISDYAFQNCTALTAITIPGNVIGIGNHAFYECDNLTSVAILNGVIRIGNFAFYGCSSLTNITIPDSVIDIGNSVFYNCGNLVDVAIPNSVTSIGAYAFRNCTSLPDITIPSGVTSIGYQAFCMCSNLISVTISDSVSNIGEYAFSGCSKLLDVYYTGIKTQWDTISVGSGNGNLTRATIHYRNIFDNTGNSHATLVEAIAAIEEGDWLKLCGDITEDVTISKTLTFDLNGYDILGTVTVADGYTLYCFDSRTDDYTVNDDEGYGKIAHISGNVQGLPENSDLAEDGYLMITEEDGVSFHRVNLQMTAMTLRSSEAGVYYKSTFAGDELVAQNVSRFGVALSVKGMPTAENLEEQCILSWFDGFEAGTNGDNKNSTLLYGILKSKNSNVVNAQNAAMPIYGRAYILTKDGQYLFGTTASRSLQEQVEEVDAMWSQLTFQQQMEVAAMYQTYFNVMQNWALPNLQAALAPQAVLAIEKKEEAA